MACEGTGDHALWHAETLRRFRHKPPNIGRAMAVARREYWLSGPAVGSVAGTPTYLVVSTDQHVYARDQVSSKPHVSDWHVYRSIQQMATYCSTSLISAVMAPMTPCGMPQTPAVDGRSRSYSRNWSMGLTSRHFDWTGFLCRGVGGIVYHRSISVDWTNRWWPGEPRCWGVRCEVLQQMTQTKRHGV